jgi:REP element-mobilizing transposase RayT
MNASQPTHRKSMRLDGYDYAQPGGYFVTIVTQGREMVFGEVCERKMHPSHAGNLVRQAWLDLPRHYANIEIDLFCIMPNHFHGIVFILDSPRRGGSCMPAEQILPARKLVGIDSSPERKTRPYVRDSNPPLSEIIRAFKSFSARRINSLLNRSTTPLWQRNYYEHIIRDETDLARIREYIINNPARWEMDEENR